MNIYNTFLRFVNIDGSIEYVSLYTYYSEHQDCYQGDLDEVLYKKVGLGLGIYVPIDFNENVHVGDTNQEVFGFQRN